MPPHALRLLLFCFSNGRGGGGNNLYSTSNQVLRVYCILAVVVVQRRGAGRCTNSGGLLLTNDAECNRREITASKTNRSNKDRHQLKQQKGLAKGSSRNAKRSPLWLFLQSPHSRARITFSVEFFISSPQCREEFLNNKSFRKVGNIFIPQVLAGWAASRWNSSPCIHYWILICSYMHFSSTVHSPHRIHFTHTERNLGENISVAWDAELYPVFLLLLTVSLLSTDFTRLQTMTTPVNHHLHLHQHRHKYFPSTLTTITVTTVWESLYYLHLPAPNYPSQYLVKTLSFWTHSREILLS